MKKTSEEGAPPALSPFEQALDGAVKGCGALAAFYNKPLWDGRSRFDDAIATLQRCTSLKPDDACGYQKIATFFWDKAYRDPIISEEQKRDYAEKGMADMAERYRNSTGGVYHTPETFEDLQRANAALTPKAEGA